MTDKPHPPIAQNGGDLVKRLRDAGRHCETEQDVRACEEAADHIEALERELAGVKAELDAGEIGMPGGTTNWTLLDRVHIAVGAATDQEDRQRATSAESTVTALRERLEGIQRIASDTPIETWQAAVSLLDRIAYIAKGPAQ